MIMRKDPWKFEFSEYLQDKYGYYIPESRKNKILKEGREPPELPIRIFRENKTVADIRKMAEELPEELKKHSEKSDLQLSFFDNEESCEIFTQCGN